MSNDTFDQELLDGEGIVLDPPQEVVDTNELVGAVDETQPLTPSVSEPALEAPPAAPVSDQQTAIMRKSLIDSGVDGSPSPQSPYRARADLANAAPATPSFATPAASNPVPSSLSVDDMILAGATVLPTVRSRAGARWASAILILLFTPVTWYLLADSSARLAFAEANPMVSGILNPAALMELAGGLIFVILIMAIAARSSLGLFLSGTLLFLAGLPFLIFPAQAGDFIASNLSWLSDFNDFGANIVRHLEVTGFTGLLTIAGVFLFCAGAAIASSRRAGRRDEATRAVVAATNPDGMNARWARKATERAQQGR